MIDTTFFTHYKKLIIGLSGGADSIYLLHQLVAIQETFGLQLTAVHLDHEWRANSHKDAEFCKALCNQLGVPFIINKASELSYQPKHKGSQEEVGRNLRRYYFEIVLKKLKADAIVLAHHANDQQETFFIRLIRGTSISGLSCMKKQNGFYLRPLLKVNKTEIIDYLQKNNFEWIEDPSNESDDFLRNRIRKYLSPALQKCDERAQANLLRAIEQLQETEMFLQKETEDTYKKLTHNKKIDIKLFKNLEIFIQKRVICLWLEKKAPIFTLTESFIDEIIRFLISPRGGTHQLGTTWSITKKQNKALLINTQQ